MATFGAYNAGSARIYLRPALANNFRASVKTLLEPVDASLNVTLKPQLEKGFNANVKKLAKTAAEQAGAKIEFGHKLAPKFRTTLKAAAKLEATEARAKIYFSPELAKGFRTTLRGKVNEAAAGAEATVTLKLSEAGLRQKIRSLKSTLPEAELRVKLDLSEAVRQLQDFRTLVSAQPLSMNVNVDTTAAVAQLMALRSLAASVGNDVGAIGTAGTTRAAQRLTGNIFTRPIRAVRIQVELDRASVARAQAQLANVEAQLQGARRQQEDTLGRLTQAEQRHAEVMSSSTATASSRTNAENRLTRARRDHADATGRLTSLMGQERDAHEQLGRAQRDQGSIFRAGAAAIRGFDSALSSGLQSLFSFSNIAGLAKVALIGLAAVSLVPLLGQLAQAAGVIALLPAAASSFAAVIATIVVGTRGIGDAFKAAEKATENSAKQAEARAKEIASAQKSVESAARGVASAERGVQSAQKASATAQKALTKAREDAADELEDLNRQLGRTSLNEEGAALAVAEAYEQMQETFRDSDASALDRRRAVYSYNQALADQQDTLRESRELQEQVTEANAKGVEGSDQVVAAKERVADAAQAEIDAQQALTDANRQLAEAQSTLTQAMNSGGDAAEELERKLGKLPPSARAFVQTMLDLKPALGDLRMFVQERLFDKLGDSISSLTRNSIPTLKTGLGDIATAINNGVRRAMADLDTEASRSKFAKIFDNTAKSIEPLLNGINNVIQAFLSLSGAGSEFLPGMSEGFENLTLRFREWAESDEGQTKFKAFLRESLDTFKQIWDIVVKLGAVINNLFKGSDETGESWLDSIETTLSNWADFLGSEEGQQKVKDFFAEVKATVQAIVDALKTAYDLADGLGLLPEPEPTGTKPQEQAPEDRTGPDGGGLNGFSETSPGPTILDPQGSDGGGLGGFKPSPAEAHADTEIDPSRTKRNKWMGNEYYNYKGERVDKDGNKLDHTGGIFPGVKEGSIGDKILDSPILRSGTGLGGLWQWLSEDDDEANAKLTGLAKNFEDVSQSAETNSNSAGTSWTNFGTKVSGLVKGLLGAGGAMPELSTGQKQVSLDADEHVDKKSSLSWTNLGTSVKTVVDKIIGSEVLGTLTSNFTGLPSFFDGITSGIGSAWGELPGKLSGPINSVIDILNTFGDLWNKVADKLGLPKWDPIDKVGGASNTNDPFAGRPTRPEQGGHVGGRAMGGPGGPVKGPGGPKDDKAGLYRLSNGEHVWTAAEVSAAGGHDAMYKMRAAALQGGGLQSKPVQDGPAGYADGGKVQTSDPLDPIQAQLWDLVRTAIPDAVLTSGKRFADVGSGYDLHMQGKAIDLGGPMKQIARWIYQTYPQSAELIHWPLDGWQNLDEGQPHDFGAATNAGHQDHVHWAANDFLGNLSDEEKANIFSRIGSALSSAVNSGRNALANSLLLNPLRNAANSVPEIEGLGTAGKIPKAFAQKMVDALASKVLSTGSSGGGGANYVPSAGVEQWRDLAIQAMRREGFNADDPAQVNAMMAQIQSESGGNPSIIQGVQDVNSGGNEAQGLLQVIPGTFASFRDPSLPDDRTDPMANMVAALRYYKSKYGMDLTTMWGQGHGYDQGGIFKNNTWGFNMSGLPEAVLTNPEWRMFDQFVQSIPGFNQQLQTLEGPAVTGFDTDTSTTSPTSTDTSNSGVETFEQVGTNAQSRFSSALSTGFEDLVSTTLDPLGLPDPRDLIPSEVTDYGSTLASWQQARSASAQASQTLAQSGYQAASVPATGAANTVIQGGGDSGSLTTIDNSTTINLTTPNVDEAYRKAELIRDMRALQHTATARG